MDPNTTLQEALEAMIGNDPGTAVDALRDLADWIERGGFLPHVGGPGMVDVVTRATSIGA